MKILDVVTAPWAIMPEKLVEIQEIYITHLRGEKIDFEGIKVRLGISGKPEKTYTVENSVAIIPIDDVISKRMTFFSWFFGGTSSQQISQDFRSALADPSVNAILLYIDSPGGSVDGTQELAQEIYNARGQKPIISFTDGMMASAAYWIGAATDQIFISGGTVQVGSIGVVARHIDVSKREEMIGYKTSEIYAGKYKRIASNYAPLSESGRQSIQDAVDFIYNEFVGNIARYRGLSIEPVKNGRDESIPWADGRVFYGTQSLEVGLVDGVSTMAALIEKYGDRNAGIRDMVQRDLRLKGISK